jgi:tyrosine-protein kinase Etk/Wzc
MKSENIQRSQNPEEKEFNIKKIIYLLLRQWRWFALFGVFGLFAGFVYTKFTKPKYSVYTSILIPQETDGLGIENMFKGFIDKPKNNVYNQIELVRSYSNISQTLMNLNSGITEFH